MASSHDCTILKTRASNVVAKDRADDVEVAEGVVEEIDDEVCDV
jgi:hypothetical protein